MNEEENESAENEIIKRRVKDTALLIVHVSCVIHHVDEGTSHFLSVEV